jgi:hypothetical protein
VYAEDEQGSRRALYDPMPNLAALDRLHRIEDQRHRIQDSCVPRTKRGARSDDVGSAF